MLKALAYFADIEDKPVEIAPAFAVNRPELEHFISEAVRRGLTTTLHY